MICLPQNSGADGVVDSIITPSKNLSKGVSSSCPRPRLSSPTHRTPRPSARARADTALVMKCCPSELCRSQNVVHYVLLLYTVPSWTIVCAFPLLSLKVSIDVSVLEPRSQEGTPLIATLTTQILHSSLQRFSSIIKTVFSTSSTLAWVTNIGPCSEAVNTRGTPEHISVHDALTTSTNAIVPYNRLGPLHGLVGARGLTRTTT